MKIYSLNDIQSVDNYLKRIGAEPRSMRSAVIREQSGRYWRDIAVIKLQQVTENNVTVWEIVVNPGDGESDVSAIGPTDVEKMTIAVEAALAEWPEMWTGPKLSNLPDQVKNAPASNVFEFRDKVGNITMLQVRIDNPDGSKSYVPWTAWHMPEGIEWRNMEPEGLLPLWGLDGVGNHTTVFIHEGAKAARHVRWMIQSEAPEAKAALAAHPWGVELASGAHVGWIGGALSPHRTNWLVLKQMGVVSVSVVADRDNPGEAAIRSISKALSRWPFEMTALKFDRRFPQGFDLADNFPDSMFMTVNGRQAYAGSRLEDLIEPATWATQEIPQPSASGRGRPPKPSYRLRDAFTREWVVVSGESKALFVNLRNRSRIYTEEAFNTLVRPRSDATRTADLLKHGGEQVSAIAYEPGEAEVIEVEGQRSINTWQPPTIRPTEGDVQPWLDLLEHVFPVKAERHEVMKWIATLIARPRVRMLYALLLYSVTQGVGKTTICEVLRRLVGERNSHAPSASSVVDSPFNGWLVRKRFIFVNEIYEGGNWKAYQRLKSLIADGTLSANEKMVPEYTVKNWAHFILCSNSTAPIAIEADDRRIFAPQVTEQTRTYAKWTELHQWLRSGGYAVIAGWAEEFVREHGAVTDGARAPATARKTQIIENSQHVYERKVIALAEKAVSLDRQVAIVDDDVIRWLRDSRVSTDRVPSAAVIRRWMVKAGMVEHPKRVTVHGAKSMVCLTLPVSPDAGWADLKEYSFQPDDQELLPIGM